jgi:hypothetical protein
VAVTPQCISERHSEWVEDNDPFAEDEARRLSGQLWNCTDVLPSSLCGDLDLAQGSTYAVAARKLRQEL